MIFWIPEPREQYPPRREAFERTILNQWIQLFLENIEFEQIEAKNFHVVAIAVYGSVLDLM